MSQLASIGGLLSIPTVALSGAGTTTGTWVNIRSISRVAFQAEWTGTLAGTFSFEVTNYPAGSNPSQPPSTATATALTLPTAFASGNPAGSAGSFVFEFVHMGESWIRPKFVYASGSGNLTVTTSGKT
jgi:hypothetical protein